MCIGIPGQICAIDGNLAKGQCAAFSADQPDPEVGAVDVAAGRVSASGCWSRGSFAMT